MQTEFKAGDDAKIAASAAQRPEQVGIFLRAGASHSAIGRDHVCANQIVDRHPELPRGPPEAAAERKPGHACRRVDADRSRQTESLSLAIEVGERCSRLDPCNSRCWIHPYGS